MSSAPPRLSDLSPEERAQIVAIAFRPEEALARYEKARDEEALERAEVQRLYDEALAEREERRSNQP